MRTHIRRTTLHIYTSLSELAGPLGTQKQTMLAHIENICSYEENRPMLSTSWLSAVNLYWVKPSYLYWTLDSPNRTSSISETQFKLARAVFHTFSAYSFLLLFSHKCRAREKREVNSATKSRFTVEKSRHTIAEGVVGGYYIIKCCLYEQKNLPKTII